MIEKVLFLLELLLAKGTDFVSAEGLELVLDVTGRDVKDEGKVFC